MATLWKFESALEYIQRPADALAANDDNGEDFLNAEAFVLDWKPRTAAEAAIQLELVIDNIMAGQRADGRDIAALHREIGRAHV